MTRMMDMPKGWKLLKELSLSTDHEYQKELETEALDLLEELAEALNDLLHHDDANTYERGEKTLKKFKDWK